MAYKLNRNRLAVLLGILKEKITNVDSDNAFLDFLTNYFSEEQKKNFIEIYAEKSVYEALFHFIYLPKPSKIEKYEASTIYDFQHYNEFRKRLPFFLNINDIKINDDDVETIKNSLDFYGFIFFILHIELDKLKGSTTKAIITENVFEHYKELWQLRTKIKKSESVTLDSIQLLYNRSKINCTLKSQKVKNLVSDYIDSEFEEFYAYAHYFFSLSKQETDTVASNLFLIDLKEFSHLLFTACLKQINLEIRKIVPVKINRFSFLYDYFQGWIPELIPHREWLARNKLENPTLKEWQTYKKDIIRNFI